MKILKSIFCYKAIGATCSARVAITYTTTWQLLQRHHACHLATYCEERDISACSRMWFKNLDTVNWWYFLKRGQIRYSAFLHSAVYLTPPTSPKSLLIPSSGWLNLVHVSEAACSLNFNHQVRPKRRNKPTTIHNIETQQTELLAILAAKTWKHIREWRLDAKKKTSCFCVSLWR
jgi:hypothetical protein